MTLSVGNHVVKLDANGQPLTEDKEVYIEYEVEGLTQIASQVDANRVLAVLKKVK